MNHEILSHPAAQELVRIRQHIGLDLLVVGGYPRACLIGEPYNDIDVWIRGGRRILLLTDFIRQEEKVFPFSFYLLQEGLDLHYPVEITPVLHNQVYIELTDDDPNGNLIHFSDEAKKCAEEKILAFSAFGWDYFLRNDYDVDWLRGVLLHLGKFLHRGYQWDARSRDHFMANIGRVLALMKDRNPFYEEMVRKDLYTRMGITEF